MVAILHKNPKAMVLASVLLLASSCRVIRYNVPNITDGEIFPCRTVRHNEDNVFHFTESKSSHKLGETICVNNKALGMKLVCLDDFCKLTKTVNCLIIRHDTLLYNYHSEEFDENDVLNPFSITKAFMTTLTGIALKQGKIKDLDDKVSDYLPCYKNKDVGRVHIRQLLKHTSGIKFSDQLINPFSDNLKYYYGKHLRDYTTHLELYCEPGCEYNYNSANTQLLAMVLERVIDTTLSAYLEQELWTQTGMQNDAYWSLDQSGKNGIEKAFACLNVSPIDLAKLGRLYLNEGNWEGHQILTKAFVQASVERDISEGSRWDYQYNFGVGPKAYESFFAVGLYGQLVYVFPEKEVIIVRIVKAHKHYNPPFVYYTMNQIIDQL